MFIILPVMFAQLVNDFRYLHRGPMDETLLQHVAIETQKIQVDMKSYIILQLEWGRWDFCWSVHKVVSIIAGRRRREEENLTKEGKRILQILQSL